MFINGGAASVPNIGLLCSYRDLMTRELDLEGKDDASQGIVAAIRNRVHLAHGIAMHLPPQWSLVRQLGDFGELSDTVLGKGAQGTVFKLVGKNGEMYAVKMFTWQQLFKRHVAKLVQTELLTLIALRGREHINQSECARLTPAGALPRRLRSRAAGPLDGGRAPSAVCSPHCAAPVRLSPRCALCAPIRPCCACRAHRSNHANAACLPFARAVAGVCCDSDGLHIVLQYGEKGNLAEWLAEKGGYLDELLVAKFVAQLAKGLTEMHSAQLIHRDLKAENILVTEIDRQPYLLIADFGIAKATNQGATRIGTLETMAPEMLSASSVGYNQSADVWAMGVITCQLLTGKMPQTDLHTSTVTLPQVIGGVHDVGQLASGLVKDMLAFNPSARPTALHILARALAWQVKLMTKKQPQP